MVKVKVRNLQEERWVLQSLAKEPFSFSCVHTMGPPNFCRFFTSIIHFKIHGSGSETLMNISRKYILMMLFSIETGLERVEVVGPDPDLLVGWDAGSWIVWAEVESLQC